MKSGKTRTILTGVAILLILFVAWRWLLPLFKHGDNAKKPEPIPVDAVPAKLADVPIYVEGLGTVQAFYTVTVTPRVDGQLEKVAFAEGQQVAKGALLAQIDPRPYQAALEVAQGTLDKDLALLANARRDLERYMVLAPDELASKQTVDTQRSLVAQLEAQVKGDRGAVDNAKTQLDYTTITSPIAGRTGIRLVDPGNNVHAADSTGIVVVTQLQPISTIFSLPEDAFQEVNDAFHRGPVPAVAVSRDRKEELDRGTVVLIDNEIDQTTATIKLKATFPNAKGRLWPGEFINVQVLTQIKRQALTIPSGALQRGPKGIFTYAIKPDSTVEAVDLTIGRQTGDTVIVEKGLQAGEQVVTSNQYRLQPDSLIRIRKNPGPYVPGTATPGTVVPPGSAPASAAPGPAAPAAAAPANPKPDSPK
jgi:membrane fusion protein, multidrug efflux system